MVKPDVADKVVKLPVDDPVAPTGVLEILPPVICALLDVRFVIDPVVAPKVVIPVMLPLVICVLLDERFATDPEDADKVVIPVTLPPVICAFEVLNPTVAVRYVNTPFVGVVVPITALLIEPPVTIILLKLLGPVATRLPAIPPLTTKFPLTVKREVVDSPMVTFVTKPIGAVIT